MTQKAPDLQPSSRRAAFAVSVMIGLNVVLPTPDNDNVPDQPPPPRTPVATSMRSPANDNFQTWRLTKLDVLNLKKVTSTEVVASLQGRAFEEQVHGVVDTIGNRVKSELWGLTVAEVVNAKRQFSKINGPSRLKPYGSVENMPESAINQKVAAEVDKWLAARASGAASSVGDNLNYANPHFSDKANLKWVVKLNGPRYGAGKAIHWHGTTVDLKPFRPGSFAVVIPSSK